MMKRNKLITGILAMLLVLPLFLGLGSAKDVMAAPAEGNAELVLHKKKMTKLPNPTIQNTGGIMDGTTNDPFYGYDGLDGVTFTVYDVTADYYEAYKESKSQDAALAAVKGITALENYSQAATGITANGGILTLEVPKKSDKQDAVYLIVESKKDGVTKADNMVVAFPVYQMEKNTEGKYVYTDTELSTIHLYPKNVVSTDGVLEVTKKGTAEDEDLDGAKFIISKGTNYISGAKDGLYQWTAAKDSAYKFETDNSYAPGESAITINPNTDSDGKLFVSGLEVGQYTLTETDAPKGAEMITGETVKTFDIIAGATESVKVTVMNDTILVDKVAPNIAVETATGMKNAGINELIDYEISANIPKGIADMISETEYRYTTFKLTDKHDPALTFTNADYSLVVRDTSVDPVEEVNVEDLDIKYSVEVLDDENFEVSVSSTDIHKLKPNQKLVFKYQMYLNETATLDKGFDNTAGVEAGKLTDTSDPVTVHTGGKRFVKIDVDSDVEDRVTLAGAEFKVRRGTGTAAEYLAIDKSTNEMDWTADMDAAHTFITLADGLVDIKGLAYGKYTLIETKAPPGYVTPVSPNNETEFDVSSTSYGQTTDLGFELIGAEEVPNKHKGSLPSTGGSGIVAFVLIGVVAVGGAVLYFTKGRRQIEG